MKKINISKTEILITLIIFFIILLILVPTLVKNSNASQFKTVYKELLSSFKHKIAINVAIDDFDFRLMHNSKTSADQLNERSLATIITNRMENSKDITKEYFNKDNFNKETQIMTIISEYRCTDADMREGSKYYSLCKDIGGAGKTIENIRNEYVLSDADFIVYQLDNGAAIGYNKKAEKCIESTQENCVGFIDVNGVSGPNQITDCDTEGDWTTSCTVSNNKIFDIFPIIFYNQSVEPGSIAAKSIFDGMKINK